MKALQTGSWHQVALCLFWYLACGTSSSAAAATRWYEASSIHSEIPPVLEHPSDIAIYVTTHDTSPVGDCSAESWVAKAVDFGYNVFYYGQNATRKTATGKVIPTRKVADFGALNGTRDSYEAWPRFTARILEDLLQIAPKAKFIMRLDDDSVLNPKSLWKSLLALPLKEATRWMIGDCGNDEHHAAWCSGGAGILMSRHLAEQLLIQLDAGIDSVSSCAVIGRNDDDTLGICAESLGARIVSHHGYHSYPPAPETRAEIPWYAGWPRLNSLLRLGDVPTLDGCPAQRLGKVLVVKDWITYHHTSCDTQRALSSDDDEQQPEDVCAGVLSSNRDEMLFSIDRCKSESELSQAALCMTSSTWF